MKASNSLTSSYSQDVKPMSQEGFMLRFLFRTIAVFACALPASAQDAEVGQEYEITIATEEDNQYTGPYGQVRIGAIVVNVPDAKEGERYNITITAIATNQYSGYRQASCEFEQIGGDRSGMCLPAP